MQKEKRMLTTLFVALLVSVLFLSPAIAQQTEKPNILVIFGDDIGMWNISAYHRGMMGGSTPNIDRIANEGALFTDYYSQQSCTAGRAAFITGQHPFRTGLLTIGMPGSKQGLQPQDPTLAELLTPHGYVSGQFGKNHLGDLDEFLPTNHGFQEFYGNLYHLNAEEEPETYNYPKDAEFHEQFGPRGVIHSYADGRIEDTGPLTRKRMETVDEEFRDGAIDFMQRAINDDKPFFVWLNSTRMHVWTRLSPEWDGKTGYGLYADGMAQHDYDIGIVLDKLDEWGIADNTIVVYSTDNGAEKFTWPDGGTIPFRGEKGSTWEGGFRVPAAVRWPGVVKPGTIINDIFSHEDWVPTLVAAAGDPNLKDKLMKGDHKAAGKTFKTHLDGYDQTALLSGKGPGARNEIFYFDAAANLNAVRYRDWKIHFTIMEGAINEAYRKSPAWPVVVNLRQDPFEVTPDSAMYTRWYADLMWLFVPAQAFVGQFLETFKEFPPSQASGSLSVEKVLQQLQTQSSRQ
ncbi:MAG: arylsulfatase [Acidobacteria bacterium]|nr:MAG: arylsulfatase [Acidobacteriota bacterium]